MYLEIFPGSFPETSWVTFRISQKNRDCAKAMEKLNITSFFPINNAICTAYIFASTKPTLGPETVKASAYD